MNRRLAFLANVQGGVFRWVKTTASHVRCTAYTTYVHFAEPIKPRTKQTAAPKHSEQTACYAEHTAIRRANAAAMFMRTHFFDCWQHPPEGPRRIE